MPRLVLRTAFHGAVILHHSYAIWTACSVSAKKYDDPVVSVALGYGPRYLTYWNLIFQLVFMVVSLRCDLAEWTAQQISSSWSQLRERMFHGLVFPFTLYVSETFWVLYALNREYVYPLIFDTVIPIWLNHSVHTVVILVLAAELMLQPRIHVENGPYYKFFIVATCLYSIVYHMTYFIDGVWLYQFYNLMSWPFIFLWLVNYLTNLHLLYHIQWPLLQYLYNDSKGDGKQEESNGVNSQCECYKNKANGFGERNGKFEVRAKVL